MDNMADEILDAICDTYKDDKDMIASCARFLYCKTHDETLIDKCVKVIDKLGYCLACGTKMVSYEYEERHDELEGNNVETNSAMFCPICDRYEIKMINAKEGCDGK